MSCHYADTPNEVLETINFLKQLKSSPTVHSFKDDDSCPICLEEFFSKGYIETLGISETPVALPCGHVMGSECLERYLSPFGEARNTW